MKDAIYQLTKFIRKTGIPIYKLADEVNIPRSTLYNFMSGKSEFLSMQQWDRLAKPIPSEKMPKLDEYDLRKPKLTNKRCSVPGCKQRIPDNHRMLCRDHYRADGNLKAHDLDYEDTYSFPRGFRRWW